MPPTAATRSTRLAILAAAALVVSAPMAAQVPVQDAVDPDTGLPVLEEVLITGSQPGPGMWRISRDQNTLWLLGTVSPLPRRMAWNSSDVEAVIAGSQQVIGPPSARFEGIGRVRGLFLLPALLGARKNPDDARLEDVLPPELYQRWQQAKARHMPRNRAVERWRPVFAVQKLYQEAIQALGLRFGGVVWPVVERTAKRNRVEIVTPSIEVELAQPRQAIKAFSRSALDDLECFQLSLDRLDLDLGNTRARALAWAEGDLERIATLTQVDPGPTCIEAVLNSSVISSQGMADLPQRLRAAWMDAVDRALAQNTQSFAILPMAFLLGEDGALAHLETRGYRVEAPE
jgi:uncharacterized protein YbaP (TraB family)